MVNSRAEADRIARPKRLRTAYSFFVRKRYHDVAKELGVRQPQPIIRRLGEMWRRLSQQQREVYLSEWARQHAGRPLGYLNRRRKEVDSPTRPRSAFYFFRLETYPKVQQEMPAATVRERDWEIIRKWRALDDASRSIYNDKAEKDRTRYGIEMKDYHFKEQDSSKQQQRRRLEQLQQQAAPPVPDDP